MFSNVFLAATASELTKFRPQRSAYMACHFSSYGSGLSNMPDFLPDESMLLLDDSMPPDNHNRSLVAEQLTELIEKFAIKAILLDFQRQKNAKATEMVSFLTQALPCSVAVTEIYAKELGCPVLLSPLPVDHSLQTYLDPWLQQGVYLEIAPEAVQITISQSGSNAIPFDLIEKLPLYDKTLCCHYDVKVFSDKVLFYMMRTKEDLMFLVQQATQIGVRGMVGLLQELITLE